ncbi:hypothetical protein AU489_13815 [Lonsdalea populi]|uniref:Uncharacterized protein n=2 Tax=Lonsdalea TaxID=1082702 RepID=A0ACD1JCZ9_9GAMM|nr:hypothetical protein AU485_07370 [Lonsdalea quercina]RAT21931.1 hypothetical protein AU489_13815 [Lonsdalea populi]RAT21977.1 hypothetical protein AU487_04500 [Lonsdalea populi]RAT22179.1 hypothetical protein AU488_11540 [Lonsdalea populi]RAT34920.1 hypothetical protein AU492_07245 [Lonsdalea populi]
MVSTRGVSPAYDVIKVVAPQQRVGGMALNGNAEPDCLGCTRDPKSGFISVNQPSEGSTELALKVR